MDNCLESISLPSSIDAEKAILGSIMLDNGAFLESSMRIFDSDFYYDSHRTIYAQMMQMFEQGLTVDIITLQESLRRAKQLEAIGGVTYLATLTEGLPRFLSLDSYLRIIKDKSLLRQVIAAGSAAVYQAADDGDAPLEVINTLESRISEIARKSAKRGYSRVGEILSESFGSIDNLYRTSREITGLATHYTEFDRYTRGLQPSDLVVIAARPSMGKTAWAINIAQRVAVHSEKTVLVFSLEMSKEALLRRMLSSQALIDLRGIQTGNLPEVERETLTEALERLVESKIFIDDTANISLAELKSKATRLKNSAEGLDLIVVDYLQLMAASGPGSKQRFENRTQEVSAISRGLKAVAKELNVPVVALSQLSRASEQRTDKKPVLSDLRESGSIEQDADVVAFIHRESYYQRNDGGKESGAHLGKAEIIIAKQRNGPVGSFQLAYLSRFTSFENLEMRWLADEANQAA